MFKAWHLGIRLQDSESKEGIDSVPGMCNDGFPTLSQSLWS